VYKQMCVYVTFICYIYIYVSLYLDICTIHKFIKVHLHAYVPLRSVAWKMILHFKLPLLVRSNR
jgi:hypothetical protein